MNPFENLSEARFRRAFLPSQFDNFTPGTSAWSELSSHGKKKSAVALLFIPPKHDSFARIVLTRRSSVVRTHKGQIGFAGGRMEPGDLSPAETVLREIHEEIGINPQEVNIHGMLLPQTSIDGSLVVPVVATANVVDSQLVPAEAEVAAIHLCSWVNFKVVAARRFSFTIFGNRRESWLFNEGSTDPANSPNDNPVVWGLTAEILVNARME